MMTFELTKHMCTTDIKSMALWMTKTDRLINLLERLKAETKPAGKNDI